MTSMPNKLAIAAAALWVVTALGAAVLFVRGHTAPASDGRTAILLTLAERDFVLAEMRDMLISVQQITEALASGEGAKAAAAARAAGGHANAQMPIGLMAQLPLEFKQAGMAMHAGFNEIAAAVDQGESPSALSGKLAIQLSTCVGCHQSYRIDQDR
jgi:cytochrome c556